MELKEIVYSRSALELATIAKEFCSFLEELDTSSTNAFISTSHKLLPLLYYKATLLPKTQPISEDSNEQFVTELEYALVENRIAQMLRHHNDFLVINPPESSSTEDHSLASIGEYFADIFQDMKNFYSRYQTGDEEVMNDAIWECSENFRDFWGIRLAILIKELHTLHYSDIDFDHAEEPNGSNSALNWNQPNAEEEE